MKANTDETDPASWAYWDDVHMNNCPHSIPYFFAWHRGYLYYFEQQLRTVSGDNAMTLPYWDYYSYPIIPSEFLDSATGNPLYVTGRINSDVRIALSMAPFSPTIDSFQRGTSNSYEESFESAPHNPVHDVIGGWMADMQSPNDPIFYLHHANVDRLFDGWAGSATNYPSPTDPYWSDFFTYAPGLTLARSDTYEPSLLNYQYDNSSLPQALPPSAQRGRIIRVQAQRAPIQGRPPIGNFPATPARQISANRRSLGGAANVKLNHNSVSVLIELTDSNAEVLRSAVSGRTAFANVVFDGLAVYALGKVGGYFYKVYANLPLTGDADTGSRSRFLGTVGPFEASAAQHHAGGALILSATDVFHRMTPAEFKQIVVSVIRVDGTNSPRGDVMSVREVRIELSSNPY
jgi:tyrosinase